jgi:hypothetical protein
LKREAAKTHRSVSQQAIVLLEEMMQHFHPVKFPPPTQTLLSVDVSPTSARKSGAG